MGRGGSPRVSTMRDTGKMGHKPVSLGAQRIYRWVLTKSSCAGIHPRSIPEKPAARSGPGAVRVRVAAALRAAAENPGSGCGEERPRKQGLMA